MDGKPITLRPFGVTSSGEPVTCYRLVSSAGLAAEVLDYGCVLRSLEVPDGAGRSRNVCLGYETLGEYEAGSCYLGAVVGRCAGRIGGGEFALNGETFRLAVNAPPNHLHGGVRGFDQYVWRGEVLEDRLVLRRTSPDGEEGYPGTLEAAVTYRWSDGQTLALELEARTDRDTVVSLTHHGYWNLSGEETVEDHLFACPAETFAAADGSCLATGELLPVEETPFDFRSPAALGGGWDAPHPQIAVGHGYDHTFLLPGGGLRRAGTLAAGGLALSVATTLPGLHLYTGNFLPRPRSAAALEAQFIPDAVHHPGFPQTVLRAGETWRHTIAYTVSPVG